MKNITNKEIVNALQKIIDQSKEAISKDDEAEIIFYSDMLAKCCMFVAYTTNKEEKDFMLAVGFSYLVSSIERKMDEKEALENSIQRAEKLLAEMTNEDAI